MKKTAPLSKVQYGLYVECVAHQGEPCYNLPYLYVLDGSLDEERLRQAIETAVAAHPTLFTRIELNEQGDPLQTIDFKIEGYQAKNVNGRILTSKNVADYNDFQHPAIVAPADFKGATLKKGVLSVNVPAKSIIVLSIK